MPVTPDDHRFLYWLANAGDNSVRWRHRMQLPPFELFVHNLHSDVLAQFVVLSRASGDRVGHVASYSADLRSGTVYLGCVMHPDHLGEGIGRDAIDAFSTYLFLTWPFRKIYAEVPDFTFQFFSENGHDLGGRESNAWTHEATLRDHLYCAGRYWDVHTVSLDRGSN